MFADRPFYPVDPWRIRELELDPSQAARNETIFSLANGHLGMRGNLEESAGNVVHGTYVNGFYEEAPIAYGEAAFGFARNHQVLLNVADGKRLQLIVGDEPLDLSTGTVEACERSLDLRTGVLTRTVRWRSPAGTSVEVTTRRLVSLARPEIAAIELAARVTDGPSAALRVESAINARVRNQEASADPRVGAHLPPEGALLTVHHESAGGWGAVVQRTRVTHLAIAASADHLVHVDGGTAPTITATDDEDGVMVVIAADVPAGATLTVTKLLAYCTSLDHPEEALVERARAELDLARDVGFEALVDEQRAVLDRFWGTSDVEIDGDGALQQGVRFNLFSLFQSAGRDGRTSLAAKGLTGRGLRGPLLLGHRDLRPPVLRLHAARRSRGRCCSTAAGSSTRRAPRARDEPGAAPCSRGARSTARRPRPTSRPAPRSTTSTPTSRTRSGSTWRATGDRTLLADGGAEVLVETARLWVDLGDFIPARDGAFCINEVTGPDEYTALVNNNALHEPDGAGEPRGSRRASGELAAERARRLRPRCAARSASRRPRSTHWRRAADAMYVPRRRGPRRPRAGRLLPRPGAVGLRRRRPRRELPAAPALPPAGDLPPPGDQAGRRRARAVLLSATSSRPPRRSATSTTTTR